VSTITLPTVTIIGNPSGAYPDPLTDPIAWMSITVASMTIGPRDGTGYVRLKRAARPYKWQKKDAPGQDGETKTYRGKKPPDFELEFWLWTALHFTVWQTLSTAAFLYDASKTTVDPTDVYHPALAMVGISQVTVDSLGAPEQQGDKLLWIATVKVCEYFPPIAANVTQTPAYSLTTNDDTPGAQPVAAEVAARHASIAAGQHVLDALGSWP